MLYMNSMSQEKTGVSACEVLFGHNPNLPSDISYTPVTSLSNDREGYVKQLKRDLQDIRQKLSRILGHDRDQSINPFSLGDKVIIALLPQENTHKFMPKWKGPFLVTKVPNRFQIEYFDGSAALRDSRTFRMRRGSMNGAYSLRSSAHFRSVVVELVTGWHVFV